MSPFEWLFTMDSSGHRRLFLALSICTGSVAALPCAAQPAFDPARGILLRGTVVTMDDAGTIFKGTVLVRSGHIVAVWKGSKAPTGTPVNGAVTIDLGQKALIFPGLINLHDHPSFDILPSCPTPSSHVQTAFGRPLGTEPYANRYQWNRMIGSIPHPPEFRRLINNPSGLLTSPEGLGHSTEVVKFAEVRALLGGETATQGSPADPATDDILIRNVDQPNFGRDRIASDVSPIDSLVDADVDSLLAHMRDGLLDAWIVHLAEGVRDGQRRPGDAFSSRAEFASLVSKGLLTDMTVIVHGTGLEAEDFTAMRAAPNVRIDEPGDGRGAKLVWSPLSNLLLYGQTALVYRALQAGVLVSLGTDWTPSGSRTLLDELKIADITLRDPRLLGLDRDLVPAFATAGKSHDGVEEAERALDEQLVRMVTSNPAKTLRWDHEVGSIDSGKVADLVVITKPGPPSLEDLPASPYRSLIDATERDVRLVLVDGEPLAGDVEIMSTLKPGDFEVVSSASGGFEKAVDVTKAGVPRGAQTFASIEDTLRAGLAAMGGDHPPPGGGTAPNSNTYSYLKARIPGAAPLTNFQFRQAMLGPFGVDANNRLNIEGIALPPVFIEDDDFYFHILEADATAGGIIADLTPPFGLYPTHFNQVQPGGNPFEATAYRNRYYTRAGDESAADLTPIPGRVQLGAPSRAGVSPNPLTAQSLLTFTTTAPGHARVTLFDAHGRRVRNVLDEPDLAVGTHRARIDGRDERGQPLGSGIYFYRVESRGGVIRGRMLILR